MNESLFQADLSNVLKILATKIYSSSDVFIRELLQNAVDAIVTRKALEEFKPNISVSYFSDPADDSGVKIICVEDNGIGLTLEDVENFLSRIGASSKQTTGNEAYSSIGQFGIGMLSCFMVSDEVTVVSKSARGGEAVKWIGNIKGYYRQENITENVDVGTKIFLRIKESIAFDEPLLVDLLHQYGDYLEIPIHYLSNGTGGECIHKEFPWKKENTDYDEVLQFGRELFQDEFSFFIPLADCKNKTTGIAFILPRPSLGTSNAHTVYCKGVFITNKFSDILTEWAFMVKAVITSDSLNPTASREDITQDSILKDISKDLDQCIKNYLKNLGKANPTVLRAIMDLHQAGLKHMALKDPDFFWTISPWFIFSTSQGKLNMFEIKRRTDLIFYVTDLDQFQQILPIAKARNQLIVNAGFMHDDKIIKRWEMSNECFRHTDISKYGEELSEKTVDLLKDRLLQLQYHVQIFNCELKVKSFEPFALPSLLYMSKLNVLKRETNESKEKYQLWSEEEVNFSPLTDTYLSELYLNYNNPTVNAILYATASENDTLFMEMVYANALLLSQYPFNMREREIMSDNVLYLLEKLIAITKPDK